MLVIRLVRTGRHKLPHFRVVVAEKRSKLKGRIIDLIGHYNPRRQADFSLKKEKVEAWVGQGAEVSAAAAKLFNKELGFNFPVKQLFRRPKREKTKEAPAVQPAPVVEEISATEETPKESPREPTSPEAPTGSEESTPENNTPVPEVEGPAVEEQVKES